MTRIATLAAAAIVLSAPVSGHHANTGLDMASILTIEGAVTEFDWRNPHTYLSVQGSGADGEQVEWEVPSGAAAALSRQGRSVGRWEDEVLVVDTTNFAVDRSAYQNGVPSRDLKHVVERYRLHEDGTRMTAEFSVEDPEYFVGSFAHTRDLLYSPHLEMTPYNCDPEASRRYLGR